MLLSELGPRICIMGRSSSGKSTLAAAIGVRRGVPVIHLDTYRHLPGTNWQLRPNAEFADLHDTAIAGDRWVIEGNYSTLLPKRLERATGFILLEIPTGVRLVRYLRRSRRGAGHRAGSLPGAEERVTWAMVRWVLGLDRGSKGNRHYRDIFDGLDIPKVLLRGRRASAAFTTAEGLSLD